MDLTIADHFLSRMAHAERLMSGPSPNLAQTFRSRIPARDSPVGSGSNPMVIIVYLSSPNAPEAAWTSRLHIILLVVIYLQHYRFNKQTPIEGPLIFSTSQGVDRRGNVPIRRHMGRLKR